MSTEEVKMNPHTMDPHTMGLHCREETDFSGDPFSASNLVIFVMDDNSSIYHCYTREEFDNFLKAELQKNICIQKPNSAQKDESEPVMREPGSQVWLDRSILAYKDGNAFFVYLRKQNVPLRSEFGVSTFHGTPYDVYSVIPIENKNVLEMEVGVLKNEMREKITSSGKEALEQKALDILREQAGKEDISSYIFELRRDQNNEAENEEEEAPNVRRRLFEEDSEEEENNGYLEIEDNEITEIPAQRYEGRNLTGLSCRGCRNLRVIPNIPTLSFLSCSDTKIREIPELPNLEVLYCNDTRITELPILPKLKELMCNRTAISEIPLLPRLKDLTCADTDIREIPILPRLINLQCYECEYLEEIPVLPKLQKLNCNECPVLTRIPPMPFLWDLACRECPLLVSLPDIRIGNGRAELICENSPGCPEDLREESEEENDSDNEEASDSNSEEDNEEASDSNSDSDSEEENNNRN